MATIHALFDQYSSSNCNKHISKALNIEKQLANGLDYQLLGGKKLHLAKDLIRFKLGQYRLIFKHTQMGFAPETLIQRKNLTRFLKRR